jgi:hypothetical protein
MILDLAFVYSFLTELGATSSSKEKLRLFIDEEESDEIPLDYDV